MPHARSDDHNGFIWPWNLVNLCEAPSIAKYASCVNGQDFTSWLGFYVWSCTSAKTRLHLSSGKVCNPYRCMLLLDLLNNTPKWFDTILTILPKKNKNSVPVRNIVILKFLKGNGQMLELLTKQGSILMKLHTLKSKKKTTQNKQKKATKLSTLERGKVWNMFFSLYKKYGRYIPWEKQGHFCYGSSTCFNVWRQFPIHSIGVAPVKEWVSLV